MVLEIVLAVSAQILLLLEFLLKIGRGDGNEGEGKKESK